MKDSTLLAQEHSKYVRPTNRGDMSVIGCEFKLRAIDKREAEAMTGEDAYLCLTRSIGHATQSFTIRNPQQEIIGFCGYHFRDDVGDAIPWMVTSDEIYSVPTMILRYSRYVFNRYYPKVQMWNFVGRDNTLSIQWLEWLGFTVDSQDIYFKDPTFPFRWVCREVP